MRSAADPNASRLARVGLLVALAAAVQAFESLIPLPVPWFRLGLGNALILVALHLWGAKEGIWVALGKVFVGSLLSGRLLSPAFALSLSGTAAATLVMVLALRVPIPLGFVGVSALGAEAHVLAQLAVASAWLLRAPALWGLAPVLGTLAVASGVVTGLVAHGIARAIEDPATAPTA